MILRNADSDGPGYSELYFDQAGKYIRILPSANANSVALNAVQVRWLVDVLSAWLGRQKTSDLSLIEGSL